MSGRRNNHRSTELNPGQIFKITPQRTDSDCAISCLSTYTGRDYETVLIAAARAAKVENGMWMPQIQRVAAELGVKFVQKRKGRYNLEKDTGILDVGNYRREEYHVCILWAGRVIDTDGTVWADVNWYLAENKYTPGTLLVEK